MAKLDLQPGESDLGSWTIFYRPPAGGKYNGKLVVTTKRVIYDAKFDASLIGTLGAYGAKGHLEIDKGDISAVEVKKSFFSKKILLTLADSSVHIFDYGMLSVDKCAEAIKAR